MWTCPKGWKTLLIAEFLRKKSLKIPAISSVYQLLLFSLAFWPHSITGVIEKPVCKGKEEDPESLDVSLPKFKVERHEYFQT
jgi:hypothetical protein